MSESALTTASTTEFKHVRWDEIPTESVNPLLDRQLVVGTGIMLARILLKKGCIVPLHHHTNEQVTHIQSGALQFSLDGREVVVRPGEFLCIPPDMPHSAVALEDTVSVDIFTPPRADWLDKSDHYLRR